MQMHKQDKVLLNKVATTGFEMGLNVARYLGHVIKSMVRSSNE